MSSWHEIFKGIVKNSTSIVDSSFWIAKLATFGKGIPTKIVEEKAKHYFKRGVY